MILKIGIKNMELKNPKTIYGFLSTYIFYIIKNIEPISIISCDNILPNGNLCKKLLLSFMNIIDITLMVWTKNNTILSKYYSLIVLHHSLQDMKKIYLSLIININDNNLIISEYFKRVIENNY